MNVFSSSLKTASVYEAKPFSHEYKEQGVRKIKVKIPTLLDGETPAWWNNKTKRWELSKSALPVKAPKKTKS